MTINRLKTFFLVLIAALLLSGCDSESLIPKDKVVFESEQLVTVESKPDAKIYHWKQISGPKVSIPNKRVSTLEFTAPKVDKDTTMTFELKAVFDWKIRDIMLRDTVEVKVSPILIINGHRLPPEPDPEQNNATLLGIDSNNNGVRDDVERWIYINYKDKHPIHIDIAMQEARAWQEVVGRPDKAEETYKLLDAALGCQIYYSTEAIEFNEPILVAERISIKRIALNTELRKEAFIKHDKALSGGVYAIPKASELKPMCGFDTDQYKE